MDARDNNKLKAYEKVPCANCKRYRTFEGYDGCLGELIGIANACCGHGGKGEGESEGKAYIQFFDGTSVHGEDATIIQEILKRNQTSKTKEERYDFLKGCVKFLKEEWNISD